MGNIEKHVTSKHLNIIPTKLFNAVTVSIELKVSILLYANIT